MSLVGTLAKVAVGVVVAKGVSGMLGRGRASQAGQGDLAGGFGRSSSGGGIEDILGQITGGGGRSMSGSGPRGGLEDVLGQVMGGGGAARGGAGGGLQDMLGKILAGGAGAAAGGRGGGLGGALDQLSEMSRSLGAGGPQRGGGDGFGNLLNQSLERAGEPDMAPTREQEDLAGVLLRAMIQAAKSDGRLDDREKQRLSEKLQGADASDMEFVNRELQRGIDIDGLVRDVPRGAEQRTYMMSALAIDLDENSEAQYLAQLSQGLGLDPAVVNAIHDQLGLPHIFR